jgi:hypothetical protein
VASIENRREAFGLAQWLEAQETGTLPRTSIGVVLRMVSAECRDMWTLPRTSIGVVLRMGTVLAIVARAGRPFVTQAPLHHDEIFQSIEMAHIWVFGTGIRPCEFSSNPDARFTSDIHYQRMRSPIYPAVFAAVLYIADALGLGYHMTALPLCLLLQAAVSGLLPLALAHFVRNICDEPLAPPLTALAVALSLCTRSWSCWDRTRSSSPSAPPRFSGASAPLLARCGARRMLRRSAPRRLHSG